MNHYTKEEAEKVKSQLKNPNSWKRALMGNNKYILYINMHITLSKHFDNYHICTIEYGNLQFSSYCIDPNEAFYGACNKLFSYIKNLDKFRQKLNEYL